MHVVTRRWSCAVFLGAMVALAMPVSAQHPAPVSLSVDRIFVNGEFASAPLPYVSWMKAGRSWLEVREAKDGGAEIARVDAVTGISTVVANSSSLVDEGQQHIDVEDLNLAGDENSALLFHNSVRVWRTNTRGVYHVIDFRTGKLVPVSRTKGLQMFAKLSPDGSQAAFVRDNNLWITNVATGAERALTTDGSESIINGTTDWVYEEELDLRDGFRFSPDGKKIAFWRFDQSQIPIYPIITETSVLYPQVMSLRYPKAGEPNSEVRVGVIDLATSRTTWIDVGADTGIYIPRMEWVGTDSVVVQRMNRAQNKVDVLMASAATGKARWVMADSDAAYVDVDDQPRWVHNNSQFLWTSDKSGWRQVYLYDRSGKQVRQLTRDGADVTGVNGVDEDHGWVYVTEAAPDPTQRQVFRFSFDGKRTERVTTSRGSHNANISPDGRYMVDIASSAGTPPSATLVDLTTMKVVRSLADNPALAGKLAAEHLVKPQFFRMTMPDGMQLDAYRIVPANFDSTQKHPVLMYVYGGPAAPQVGDAWGGSRYMWHQMLAQNGYVVVVVDNRGSAWRGVQFRKVTQRQLGVLESQDQIDAARWIGRQTWGDPMRIGIWGWSYGGYMAAMTSFRGGPVFRAAISVAPVSDWRYYDTIYTERYMGTPQQNPDGYRKGSALTYVGGLEAHYLLVHGVSDDNVHLQNSLQLSDKLISARKPFYELFYPNSTHSISYGKSQVHLFDQLTRFVLDNL